MRDDGGGNLKLGCSMKAVDQSTGEDLDPTNALQRWRLSHLPFACLLTLLRVGYYPRAICDLLLEVAAAYVFMYKLKGLGVGSLLCCISSYLFWLPSFAVCGIPALPLV